MSATDPRAFPFERAISERARASGLALDDATSRRLAAHARSVLERNAALHLTSIVEPREFVERHLGESFDGAALLADDVAGTLLDLGSGNGYPGIPIAAARGGLRPILAESSARKAEFLRDALRLAGCAEGAVLEANVRAASDLELSQPIDVLVSRAMGGWDRAIPKLARAIRPGGTVLLWAGANAREIVSRASWRKLKLDGAHPIRDRDASWIYAFRRVEDI